MTGEERLVYASGRWEIDLDRRELRSHGVPVPIGGRAFEIIEVLVRSAGELVSKDDLMARVWPGGVVEENTLQVHISAVRKALGDDRGMLRTSSGRGYSLVGDWTRRQSAPRNPGNRSGFPPPAGTIPSNLPAGPELIGRAASVRHLRDLMSAYRAVTLTGPGGIGKTKLAWEVARSLLPSFQGDGWLVELASLSDPQLVSSAVAGTLGLELGGDAISPASVARAIGGRKLLLVLDNCEHVIAAAAELAETVLRLCPGTSLLATSRELLRIDGECAYPVPPLDVPPQEQENPDDVLAHSAVQLFIARMRALRSGISPHGAELATIGAICRRLDGIPLAIELAAARAAALGLKPVLSRLDERFALLIGGRRTALPRHQTLRATLDWSYELLPEAERRLLRFLAVFAAGFTLEAAIAVMGDSGKAASTVVEDVANLVAKSLVALDGSGDADRWRLLETTRAYGLEKLGESGEAEIAARRHAEFFRDLVAPGSVPEPQPTIESLIRYGREIDNVRAALDWAFSPAGDPAIGCVLTAAYVPVWFHFELMVECRERTERALASLGPDLAANLTLQMRLHIALGVGLTFTLGSVERTRTVLEKALEIAETLDDVDAQLQTLWGLLSLRWDIGECRVAQSTAKQFSRLARRAGDPALVLVGERLIGTTLQTGGHQREARHHFERVLERYVPPRDRRHTIWFHFDQRVLAGAMLARVLWLQGFVDRARDQVRTSLEEAQATAHISSRLYAHVYGAFPISVMTGDLAAAQQAVTMLLDLATRHNATYWRNVGHCLEGKLLIKRGEFAAGAVKLRDALDACDRTGWTMSYPEFLGELAEASAALGEPAEGLVTVDGALARADDGGERWYVPELLRIKGELLLLEGGARSIAAAEDCFSAAFALAAEQGALFWELRTALSFARLRIRQDRPAEARRRLAAVYDRFPAGVETADLRSSRELLETLPA